MFHLKYFSSLFLFFVFAFSAASASAQGASSFDGGKFNGFYGGIDAAFVSTKAEGLVGPIAVEFSVPLPPPAVPVSDSLNRGPFPFGGTDNLAGGSLFAGYGITLSRFFAALELGGSYGSYDNTKAFNSPNFTSDIDITEGFFAITTRLGFLLKENLMVYSNIGWGRSWVEAEGTVGTVTLPLPSFDPRNPDPVSVPLPLNQPIDTDVTFDGVLFGGGFEYALGKVIGVEGIRARLAYTRIEQGKESFSYSAAGLSGRNLAENISVLPPGSSISIEQDQIPAQADASVNVYSFGLLYSL
ncbi:outer membrane protein [Candidatus Mycalebacterium sp.]